MGQGKKMCEDKLTQCLSLAVLQVATQAFLTFHSGLVWSQNNLEIISWKHY